MFDKIKENISSIIAKSKSSIAGFKESIRAKINLVDIKTKPSRVRMRLLVRDRVQALVFISLISQGICAVSFLAVLSRWLLLNFQDYLGGLLSIWLFYTASGYLLGRFFSSSRHKVDVYMCGLAALSFLPVTVMFVIAPLLYFTQWHILLLLVLLLAPFCLISGLMLYLYSALHAEFTGSERLGRISFLQHASWLVGAVLTLIGFIYGMKAFQIILAAMAICIISVLSLALVYHRDAMLAVFSALLLVGVVVGLAIDLDGVQLANTYPGMEVRAAYESPYGQLALVSDHDTYKVLENKIVMYDTGQQLLLEEKVHYAMAQRPYHKKVLLLSNGNLALKQEISRYNPQRIDVLVPSKEHLQISGMLGFSTGGVMVQDWSALPEQSYDVVIMDLSTIPDSRFIREMYFSEIDSRLEENGVFAFSMPLAGLIQDSPEEADALQSLSRVFQHVIAIPGRATEFIASDKPIDPYISKKLSARGVKTVWLTEEVIYAQAGPSDALTHALSSIRPKKNIHVIGLIILAVLYATLIFLFVRLHAFLGFSLGFAEFSLVMIVILSFQENFGTIYLYLALLLAAYHLGHVVSGLIIHFKPVTFKRRWIALSISVLSLTLFMIGYVPASLALVAAGLAGGTGLILTSSLNASSYLKKAMYLPAAELAGGAAAICMISYLLVPVYGIAAAGYTTGALSLLGLLRTR